MDHEVIKEVLIVTKNKKLSRKSIYEQLLSRGSLKPGDEDFI